MALFLKIIEWSDDSKDQLVYKYPLKNAGREVNQKSKLVVRESQEAIFVHKGQICDIFPQVRTISIRRYSRYFPSSRAGNTRSRRRSRSTYISSA